MVNDVQQKVLTMMQQDGITVDMMLCPDCKFTWRTKPGTGRLRMTEGYAVPKPCRRHNVTTDSLTTDDTT